MTEKSPWIVLRVRGSVGVQKQILDTLAMLRLHRVNHAVIIPRTESLEGMVVKAKDYITYGEADEKTIEWLMQKRGRLPGNKRLNAEWLKKKGISSFAQLGKEILKNPNQLNTLGIKPVFRLNPPSKGFERGGIKKPFSTKGALGYRGKEINALIQKMA